MSEAAGANPQQTRQRLIESSVQDEGLRQRLLDDPKGTVEGELGTSLPDDLEVRVVEETADVVYLVLPPTREGAPETSELPDDERAAVSGGGDDDWTSGGNTQIYPSNPCSCQ